MVLLRSDCGHRITDKGNVVPIFRCKGGPYKERIDMDTVENDAYCKTFVGKGDAYDTGSRALMAGIALNRCVTPLSPSSMALIKVSGAASL
jgi:hypothetical protein